MIKNPRFERVFSQVKMENRAAFVAFLTAGDPDFSTSLDLITLLPEYADIVELGMPFSDPMADGPAIQAASERALKAGQTMAKTFALVRAFRARYPETPLVLMGYYNPIYVYGVERFCAACVEHGVDGLIVVDLPYEEDQELFVPAQNLGLCVIRLVTPMTGPERLTNLLREASGFVYYVSVLGTTGTKIPNLSEVQAGVEGLRTQTALPIVVGFGIQNREHVEAFSAFAEGVVVGSSLVRGIEKTLDDEGRATSDTRREMEKHLKLLTGKK